MSYAAVQLLLENEHRILPLSDFMNMFTDEFNEALNERLVKAMKHAIEVRISLFLFWFCKYFNVYKLIYSTMFEYICWIFFLHQVQCVNDTKYVTITEQMCFIIHMIKVIEAQGTIKMQDLSNTLKLSIKACFPFGKWWTFDFVESHKIRIKITSFIVS